MARRFDAGDDIAKTIITSSFVLFGIAATAQDNAGSQAQASKPRRRMKASFVW
jgi:hypothetical protein